MVQYKLNFYNIRGRGEVIRLIFVAAGQKYEDHRFGFDQWSEYKEKAPLGTCPWLEIDDEHGHVTYLGQSITIARYLAKKLGLAGKNELEAIEIEMYGDQITDLQNDVIHVFSPVSREKDEKRRNELSEKLFGQTLPHNLGLYEEKIRQSGSGFLAASGLSWIDLHLVNVLEWLGEKKETALADFKRVKDLDECVRKISNIAEWIAKRPQTDF